MLPDCPNYHPPSPFPLSVSLHNSKSSFYTEQGRKVVARALFKRYFNISCRITESFLFIRIFQYFTRRFGFYLMRSKEKGSMSAQRKGTRGEKGSGPPGEMVKKLKDERMRRETLRQMRTKNFIVGGSILAVMGAIYLYTMRVTRQENFLDKEFDKRSAQASKN